MTIRWACWCTSAIFAFVSFTASLISWAPHLLTLERAAILTFACAAVAMAILAVVAGRFPDRHWIRQPKPTWMGLAAIGLAVPVLWSVVKLSVFMAITTP